eukprot:TRINITY_DN2000_c0_g1_i1.p1 TRINITY_DN2000_c0_g1~~TRINITY_DN2000_c0_g1_i1.p1  ORF type:complete len:74 (+),score=16.02 TRINITY_DN2000_c0_g1_i1:23-244(+)
MSKIITVFQRLFVTGIVVFTVALSIDVGYNLFVGVPKLKEKLVEKQRLRELEETEENNEIVEEVIIPKDTTPA